MKELNVSEEQLKELILRVLSDLKAEKRMECMEDPKRAPCILCVSSWSRRYMELLKKMEGLDVYDIVLVVPLSWKDMGHEARLRQSVSLGKIPYRSGGMPDNLGRAVTLLPVAPKDVLMKTTLYISGTYEILWVAECMKQGSRVVLPLTDLGRLSENGKLVCRKRIMEYYRQVPKSGVEIRSTEELSGKTPYEVSCEGVGRTMARRTENSTCTLEPDKERKRVISLSNMEQFVFDGIMYPQPGNIVTDLAKDRTKFLKVVFK